MHLDIPKIRALPRNIRQDVRDRMLDQYFNNKYCKKCGLYKKVHNPYIEGRGNKESKLLIVGESPGINEDLEDTLFIGSAGEILQKRLNDFDMDYYIISSVKCRSVDSHNKNKTPTPKLINCCKPFTMKLIDEIKPKVILTLGRIATNQVLNVNLSIEIARGNKFYHPDLHCVVVPTYHPMFLSYANDHMVYREFENDLKLAKALTFTMPVRISEARPRILKDPVDIRAYLEYLTGVDAAALDLETEGLDYKKDKITDISFCAVVGEGVHIKWSALIEHAEDLFRIFLLSNVSKILMNGRFDWLFLRAVGFDMKNFNFDIMLAEHTYTMSREGRESAGLYNLNMMSWKHTPLGGYKAVLGEGGIGAYQKKSKVKKEEDPTKKKRKRKKVEEEEKVEVVNEFEKELETYDTFIERSQKAKMEKSGLTPLEYYSALDSDATYRIYLKQKSIIEEQYSFVYNTIIMPLNYVLLRMTENGVRLDMDYMNQIKAEDEKEMEKIKQKLFKKVGFEFNINSTQQLGDVLFKHLGVVPDPKMKTPKTGAYKLNETALVEYAKQKPSVQSLLDYRSLKKQISTYIIGFQKYMDPLTWRVHPNYLQHTTATGRLSVTAPAIQTIPRYNRIRQMVVPSKGNKLVIGDLSQVELRILAMLSKDANMLAAFNSGKDIHAMTACNAILHIDIKQFDKENKKHSEARTISKSINFGIVYGLSAYSLAVQLEFPMKTYKDRTDSINRAQLYIDNWFRLYNGASAWLEQIKSFALKNGYVESVYGRRRYLPKVYSSDPAVREAALRQATNMPIQSCFHFDSKVPTVQGYKSIGDIFEKKEQEEIVINNKINKGIVQYSGERPIYRYYFSDGTSILCTKDHNFKILTKDMIEDWKEIGKISNEDYIVGSFEENKAVYKTVHINKTYDGNRGALAKHSYDMSIIIDEDMGWLLGVMIGNGSFKDSSFSCVFNHYDYDIAEKMKNIINTIFHLNVNVTVGKKKQYKNIWRVCTHSRAVIEFFDRCGYERAISKNKKVPKIIWESPNNVICSFINGLYTTDGTVNRDGVALTTTSKNLAYEVGNLLNIIKIKSNLVKRADNAFNVVVLKDFKLFNTCIGFSSKRKQAMVKKLYKKDSIKPYGINSDIPYWMALQIVTDGDMSLDIKIESLKVIKRRVIKGKSSLSTRTALRFKSNTAEYSFLNSNRYLKNLKYCEYVGVAGTYDLTVIDGVPEFIVHGTIVHNCASDINNIASIRLQEKMDKTESKSMICTVVHDSIICDVPEDEVDIIANTMIECMTQDMPRITIPIKADIEILDRWIKQ